LIYQISLIEPCILIGVVVNRLLQPIMKLRTQLSQILGSLIWSQLGKSVQDQRYIVGVKSILHFHDIRLQYFKKLIIAVVQLR